MTLVNEFAFYWTAAEKLCTGQNPYIPSIPHGYVLLAPPWILPVIARFGTLPLEVAQFVWLVLSVVALFISALWLWELYGEGRIPFWVVLLIASFTPGLVMILLGQNSSLLLLGLAGFLRYEQKGKYLAGAFLFLVALKPQVAFLMWAAFLLCVLFQGRWKMLLGFFSVLSSMILIALAVRPRVFQEWWTTLGTTRAAFYETPTLSTLLRHASGYQSMQYLPAVVTLVWLAWYWKASGYRWEWKTQLPLLLLVFDRRHALRMVYGSHGFATRTLLCRDST
jgi:hypothetical protein